MTKDIINISVVQKTINKEKKRFVNARELYKWLKSKRQFADWIKDRIEKYDFVENIDYFAVHKIVKGIMFEHVKYIHVVYTLFTYCSFVKGMVL